MIGSPPVSGHIFDDDRPFLPPSPISPVSLPSPALPTSSPVSLTPPSPHTGMGSLPHSPRSRRCPGSLRIWSQNVGRHYAYTTILLELRREDTDILFLQEPPWRTVRAAPSTSSL